jgi:hypothetical protein
LQEEIGGSDNVMSLDRPMNEHEAALFGALLVLVRHVQNREAVAVELRQLADDARNENHESGAATLDMLASAAEADRHYKPSPPI